MSGFDLNEHHNGLILNYLRFAKFQRHQCLKSIRGCFEDAKDTRLLDNTYTVDEISDILDDVSEVVAGESESELINSAHTNVLMMQQVFRQAQKWHLDLDADLAELENRELLDAVRRWEDSELSSQSATEKPAMVMITRKKLVPLGEAAGGATQLLNAQISAANAENEKLRARIRDLESKVTSGLNKRESEIRKMEAKSAEEDEATKREVEELSVAVSSIRSKMATEQEINAKNQRELESDLTTTKHQLLSVQHQLNMTEKELEKKFSQTGAYKNLKKMLSAKNEQIKSLRQELKSLRGGKDDEEEE